MNRPSVEKFARKVAPETTASVRSASVAKVDARIAALSEAFDDVEGARTQAAQIKDFVLDNLSTLLPQLELKCRLNGIDVHWAKDAATANQIILDLCKQSSPDGGTIVKAKSMATEEIHLNKRLIKAGYEVVETDLGEFVVQIDNDTPIAESGRIVLVENEGNNRLSTTAPDVHIAVMGLEKVLPNESDLPLFLKLLAGSATGQRMTTYVHMISGPRRRDEMDGPKEIHLIILDNGRSKVLNGPYRDILRCIRCGACLNVCPVYRQVSGHAYKHVYSGPLGAVLGPALEGVEKLPDLAKASSLCGACEEVCPVKIPIPRMLLQLREEAVRKGLIKENIPWAAFSVGSTSGFRWRMGLKMLPMAPLVKHPAKAGWEEFKDLPKKQGRDFRKWWNGRP